ncbi:hypothetical protein O6H91_20G055800 [Diphasiastrum complanatum]|uniref:Uncharacterized protein n=1 Tax=Diphasiastrum complanatum TaxID=34168 RepID=A0ACC2ARN7_DIPCM|nr:hypothetical protein O6H91_20G055800 [Diphasiastrum complanatum]
MEMVSLSAIHDAQKAERFSDLANLCDNLDLELASKGGELPEDWPYVIHLLGHILVSDLNSARFLWKRIPASVKQNQPELLAAWKIGQCMWTHNYSGVHEALHNFEWSHDVRPVVGRIAEDYSGRIFRLLSTAYSTISVTDAASYLGLSINDTIIFTGKNGWGFDPSSQMLTVHPLVTTVEQKLDASNLQSLTEYVFHLEH